MLCLKKNRLISTRACQREAAGKAQGTLNRKHYNQVPLLPCFHFLISLLIISYFHFLQHALHFSTRLPNP